MGHIGRQDDERELAGLRAVCSSTGASTNVDQLTEQVVTMATSVLYTYEVEIERAAEGGGSTTTLSSQDELAEWIANENHPLTVRVMANRIWTWAFGS